MRPRTLIIGGSRGVGKATALELASRGHDLALTFHTGHREAKEVAGELGPQVRSVLVQGDIACDGARMVDEAADALGGLDTIVVTAVPLVLGRLSDVSDADVERCFDVVTHGFRRVAIAARRHLAESHGSIVAVSSLGAERYAGYYGALGPAKAALESTVRYLAVEFGRSGIRVNAVSPCLIDDPAHRPDAPDVVQFLAATAKRTPLNRRLARPSDIARVIAALAGPDFNCVTGQIVVVDGGYSLVA
ncbi:1-cyclohexenylcarbonyl CoA reductase [Mycolicibacterium pulveris]|uniref:1-cyclohexenylcarbonyl CoA reductase n=2 Tax=Mycolicibacterium pulveris TaxID=36813 RepID=A0A7I7UQE1_MYCPV|nr:1-cyclohexenylcarbonyl CoA reductase [Mycolicibacterium pulveris]